MTYDLRHTPQNQLIEKHGITHFYLFIIIFLQHIARGINSGIITVNMQRESK